jgi:hypothetical protein
MEFDMTEEDPRCCGSGTCIIDAEGRCWCGQRWDGQKMCHAPVAIAVDPAGSDRSPDARLASGGDS